MLAWVAEIILSALNTTVIHNLTRIRRGTSDNVSR